MTELRDPKGRYRPTKLPHECDCGRRYATEAFLALHASKHTEPDASATPDPSGRPEPVLGVYPASWDEDHRSAWYEHQEAHRR